MKPQIILMIFTFLCAFTSCIMFDAETGPVTKGFQSHEEYLENMFVSDAINASGIEINYGENPPLLPANYNLYGQLTKHHPGLTGPFPANVTSVFSINKQMKGSIDFTVSMNDINMNFIGSYITGTEERFTIWGESLQKNYFIGLPSECNANIVFIVSGRKLEDDQYNINVLSIITELDDCQGFVGGWYMCESED